MSITAITCQNICKRFGSVEAVSDLNLTLDAGRFMALLGPSGCGKTTSLRMLAGFERPNQGIIEISGQQVDSPTLHLPPEKRNIGMVFQEYALFPHLNVAANIAYGVPKGVNKQSRVSEVLELVNLSGVEKRMPHELSGGQQQRVALARALAPQPSLILLDEPFSNLDAALRSKVRAEVRQILRQVKASVLLVTHDQEEAMNFADEVAVMLDGHLMQVDTPQKLYRRPKNRHVATFLGEANFLPGEVNQNQVVCELGRLPTDSIHQGSVELMVRPEEISLTLNPTGSAEIVQRDYLGHSQLITVRLPSGLQLKSRQLGSAGDFFMGQNVDVTINQTVVVYSK